MHQPEILVRVPRGDNVHLGRLMIGDWSSPCVVGRSGLTPARDKREGDGATPIGRFALRYGFYDPVNLPDFPAGLAFPFVPSHPAMWWEEEPASPAYNRLLYREPEEMDEAALAARRAAHLFDVIVPIGFNDAVVEPGRGSALYLHLARPAMTPTAGCVAIPRAALGELLARLQPGMVIDIGYDEAVSIVGHSADTAIEAVSFKGLRPGPGLIVTGGVHGNETIGPRAIRRIIDDFTAGRLRLARGRVTFVPVVNRKAFLAGTRAGDRNLNRDLRPVPVPQDNEDRIANILCPLLAGHDVLLDLHSYKSGGGPFVFVGPNDNDGDLEPFARAGEERAFACALGLPLMISGWLPSYRTMIARRAAQGLAAPATTTGVGTTEYMRFAGGYGVTVECGQHADPAGIPLAVAVIGRALAHLGLVEAVSAGAAEPVAPPRHIELVDVELAVSAGDRLARAFRTGDAVAAGELIARRVDGTPLTAPVDGVIVFPDAAPVAGEELYYFALARPGR